MTEYERMLRRALEEELYPFSFAMGSCLFQNGIRSPPYMVKDPIDLAYKGDNVVVADGEAHVVTVYGRDYRVLFEFGEFGVAGDGKRLRNPSGVDYSPDLDRLLICDQWNHRVVEVDAEGNVTNELKSIDSGALYVPHGVRYHPLDPSRFFLTVRERHYAALVDWAGREYWSFGTFGTPGTGSLLNKPMTVDVYMPAEDSFRVAIADHLNHRVVVADQTGALKYGLTYPHPVGVSVRSHILAVTSGYMATGDVIQPISVLIGNGTTLEGLNIRHIPFIIPSASNRIAFHPMDIFRVLYTYQVTVYELNLRLAPRVAPQPTILRVWSGKSVSAGERSPPYIGMFYDKRIIHFETDTAGNLVVEADPTGFGDWKRYLTEPFSAGEYKPLIITGKAWAFRVYFDAAATVSLWMDME